MTSGGGPQYDRKHSAVSASEDHKGPHRQQKGHAKFLTVPVVALLGMEFFERMAYYASVFAFTNFTVYMMGYSVSQGNALLQGFWAVTPLAAIAGSYFGDQRWGRPRTVGIFGAVYVLAWAIIALAATPLAPMFESFPVGPTRTSEALFLIGVVLLGVGYGGMKSSCSSLVADTALNPPPSQVDSTTMHQLQNQNQQGSYQQHQSDNEVVANDWADVPVRFPSSSRQETAANNDTSIGTDAMDENSGDDGDEEYRSKTSSLFRWYYWTFNCGALLGSIVGPLLLPLDDRFIPGQSNGNQYSGYYLTFWMSCGVTAVGMFVFATRLGHYGTPAAPADIAGFVKALYYAFTKNTGKLCFCFRSTKRDDCSCNETTPLCSCSVSVAPGTEDVDTPPSRQCSCPTHSSSSPTASGTTDADSDPPTPGSPKERHAFHRKNLAAIRNVFFVFSILPIYWLVGNQYSSNLVLQASWLELPSGFPPELFVNVNTISSLVFLPLLDRFLLPLSVGKNRHASPTRRMMCGFGVSVVGLVWCGALQIAILQQGTINDKADYSLYEGGTMINAAWLVPPYILQGIASVLVDTTAIETGYMLAPKSMKSFVHALYLCCSSVSGWIGLLISPVVTPETFVPVFFGLAFVMALCTALFNRFVYPIDVQAHKELKQQ